MVCMAKKWTDARLDLVVNMREEGATEAAILKALKKDGCDVSWAAVKAAFARAGYELPERADPVPATEPSPNTEATPTPAKPAKIRVTPKDCPAGLRDKLMARARRYFSDGVVRHKVVKHSDKGITYAYASFWGALYGLPSDYEVTFTKA